MESHMLTAKPWQQTEAVAATGDDGGCQTPRFRLVPDATARPWPTVNGGRTSWCGCEALDNPIATEFTSSTSPAYRERWLVGELYVPGSANAGDADHHQPGAALSAGGIPMSRQCLGCGSGGNPLADPRQYKVQESELAYLLPGMKSSNCRCLQRAAGSVAHCMLCLSTGARWSGD